MADPRQRAAELLAEVPGFVWDGRSLPVPVEAIADSHCGLLVCDVTPLELHAAPGAPRVSDLSGLLLVDPRQIWVNAKEAESSPGRRRFTIGHELGHWVLHRPQGPVFCRSHEVQAEPDAPDLEEEASLFGAGLMFPPALVREHHARLDGDVAALCELFGASRAAMDRAICFAVRAPMLAGRDDVLMFHFDDDGYLEWRDAHRDDGFVLNDDLGDGRRAKLHRASCHYLHRPLRDEWAPRTRQPKLCALDVTALTDLLPRAARCGCLR